MESNAKTSTHASQVSLVSNRGNTNTNSPKLGSRRIFTPQFKLQVLESYRNDSDCKGNQRATARKYNIHRRQIQKWLQCESSLRSSVANINHNSVKHQFHNVSMQHQQQQQQTKKLSITTNSSIHSSYTANQHSANTICPDSTRPSVSLNSMKVPSLSTGVAAPSTQTQGIFEAANLAAAVAAAAGAITITSTNATGTPAETNTTPDTPVRPSAIISANRNTTATISPIIHHHHYGISSYSHIPTAVPILTQHLSHPPHIHQPTHQPHQSYQYHNMAYSSTLTHQSEKQQPSSFFTPVSLPTINVLSAAANTVNSCTIRDSKHTDKMDLVQLRSNPPYPKFFMEKNNFVCNEKHHNNYESNESAAIVDPTSINLPFSDNQLQVDAYPSLYPFGPMDLSLRHRREIKSELVASIEYNIGNSEIKSSETPACKGLDDDKIDVVDLTYRKRRVQNTSNTVSDYKNQFLEKQPKLSNLVPNKIITYNSGELYFNNTTSNTILCNEDDDIEIEVGTEEKFPPSKPVKLFKPYLLDEGEINDDMTICNHNNFTKNEQAEKDLKSCCAKSTLILNNYDVPSGGVSCHENTFPVIAKENINTCTDGSTFLLDSGSGSPRSAFSPATSAPTLSPINFQSPKGSPTSSGYESSTSTYSESSLSSKSELSIYGNGQTYSINLQMQTIYNDNIVLHPSKHVQNWLDEDESKPLTTNSSIALLV